ncbi:aldose epimerase family protein [Wenyingzhuangia sp. IMCC45467]
MKLFKKSLYIAAVMLVSFVSVQCKDGKKKEASTEVAKSVKLVTITKESFGTTEDHIPVENYILKNSNGMEVSVITYGGIIKSLKVPNKDQVIEDVVLGFNSLAQYEKPNPYFGALIGRFGNRIAKGKFSLDGKEYTLATNDGENHLHGGPEGFHRKVWKASEKQTEHSSSLVLSYLSKDMEEGYPGNLQVEVTYTLTDKNDLAVSYSATTDKKTVLNLTQHSYFNLSGDFSKTILDHDVTINADRYLPVDATLIPTGELRDVTGNPFDFREAKQVGKEINNDNEQLKRGLGYDHCWVLNETKDAIGFAASAYDKASGRLLEVFTNEPAIQFYTGNFLDGTLPSKQEGTYGHRTGFCLETQHYPDSPNQEDFPSVTLEPGQNYKSSTVFRFSVK